MKKLLSIILIAGVALAFSAFTFEEEYSQPCAEGSEVVCSKWRMLGNGIIERTCFCADEVTGDMTGGYWIETKSLAP